MERCLTAALPHHVGEEVRLQGWQHTLRDKGGVAFLVLRDRSGLAQVVMTDRQLIDRITPLQTGSVLDIRGTVVVAKTQLGAEVTEPAIDVLYPVAEAAPVVIAKEELEAELDTLLDHRVVTLRHPKQQYIFRVAARTEHYIREFLESQDFTQINTPKIIAFPTEGGSEVFPVQYFDRTAYLAQSPQFYKQMMVPVFERVYEIGHAYRAEPSSTSRHMSEILMLDVEMGFISGLDDILAIAEGLLHRVCEGLMGEKLLSEAPALSATFPRITVEQLHAMMLEHTGEDHRGELDVAPSEERFICSYAAEHWGSDAVFVTEFPWEDAKFYHHQNRMNPAVADRADLLFRGVEIATLTQREVSYDKLREQIVAKGADPDHPGLTHYLSAFRYGMPDEGGFGLGIARLVQKLLGLANVKEAELFPRDTKRVTP